MSTPSTYAQTALAHRNWTGLTLAELIQAERVSTRDAIRKFVEEANALSKDANMDAALLHLGTVDVATDLIARKMREDRDAQDATKGMNVEQAREYLSTRPVLGIGIDNIMRMQQGQDPVY